MSDEISIPISIPTDENGLIGRECLECKRYFKLKPGTGLPTNHCHCPYCEYEGDTGTFWTPAQLEYAQSVAINKISNDFLRPHIDKLAKSLKDIERNTRNSFIQFKVTTEYKPIYLPIKYYNELELETSVTCDNCGLEFAVYGVFARCPDCNQLNAFLMYGKSLETAEKKLIVFMKPEIPEEIRNDSLKHILSDCISAFDALGKELRIQTTAIFPDKPKNLFQNISVLNDIMKNLLDIKLSDYEFVFKMFQVRHLFEHNMGVIDDDFVKKVPGYHTKKGMLYHLEEDELTRFIKNMQDLGKIIEDYLK